MVVPATFFDQGTFAQDEDRWSFSIYGENWRTAECSGSVLSITFDGKQCKVRWDLDGSTSSLNVGDVRVVTGCDDAADGTNTKRKIVRPRRFEESERDVHVSGAKSSNHVVCGSNRASSQAVSRTAQAGVRARKRRRSPSPTFCLLDDAQLSDVSLSSPESAQKTSVPGAENSITSSSCDDSDDSATSDSDLSDYRDDSVPADVPTVLKAHDLEWTVSDISIDNYKDTSYKAKLINADSLHTMTELDAWLLFFPHEEMDEILRCTNSHLRDKRKAVTREEFYKVIGLLYLMTLGPVRCQRRDHWSLVEGIFPAPAFGRRYGMGANRFEEIVSAMHFGPRSENQQSWQVVSPLIAMCNAKWQSSIRPGYKLTVDESMFAWYGRGGSIGGMPTVIKIKRKPKGVGCEIKSIADASTNIMLGMEINEGKDAMIKKKWQKELGAGTATTLRLTKPWHGSGRVVCGDSWFASVKTAVTLMKHGLFFAGVVKTAHTAFPLKQLTTLCPTNKGQHISATAEKDGVALNAVAWRDRKVHSFVSTCGTTLAGEPAKKKRYDDNFKLYHKAIDRPKLVAMYHDGAPSIDVHNHLRQDGLALEQVWRTDNWHHRVYACVFGIMETNAYLAFSNFCCGLDTITHSGFTTRLAEQLIRYSHPTNSQQQQQQQKGQPPTDGPAATAQGDGIEHRLVSLSHVSGKPHTQRKCVVCRHVRDSARKASYFCATCGPNAVMCSPNTGRTCFQYHITHGLPH